MTRMIKKKPASVSFNMSCIQQLLFVWREKLGSLGNRPRVKRRRISIGAVVADFLLTSVTY